MIQVLAMLVAGLLLFVVTRGGRLVWLVGGIALVVVAVVAA